MKTSMRVTPWDRALRLEVERRVCGFRKMKGLRVLWKLKE